MLFSYFEPTCNSCGHAWSLTHNLTTRGVAKWTQLNSIKWGPTFTPPALVTHCIAPSTSSYLWILRLFILQIFYKSLRLYTSMQRGAAEKRQENEHGGKTCHAPSFLEQFIFCAIPFWVHSSRPSIRPWSRSSSSTVR